MSPNVSSSPPANRGLSVFGVGAMLSAARSSSVASEGGERDDSDVNARILIEVVSAMDLMPSTNWNRTGRVAKKKGGRKERRSPPGTRRRTGTSGDEGGDDGPLSGEDDDDDDDDDSTSSSRRTTSDPFCVIRRVPSGGGGGKKSPSSPRVSGPDVLHRTLPVRRDLSPIWTARTRSLYLLSANDKSFQLSGGLEFEVLDGSGVLASVSSSVLGPFSHGTARVPPEDVLGGDGTRAEYPLLRERRRPSTDAPPRRRSGDSEAESDSKAGTQEAEATKVETVVRTGTLALRFRPATERDLAFMEAYGRGDRRRTILRDSEGEATVQKGGPCDFESFASSARPPRRTKGSGHTKMYAVQPCADPLHPDRRWMTPREIDEESLGPSRRWVRAGAGTSGTLHLEVLGCDDLPNLDVGVNVSVGGGVRRAKTDAWVAALFEDALVRTDVVFDCLNPRWMPWSMRAFAFPMKHPSSVLVLGVFDYDVGPMNHHDPVGRVVVDPANFEVGTLYNLSYKLRSGPSKDDYCGVLRVRLRIEQPDEKGALLASFGSPARYHINVDSAKAFSVLRYLCRGSVNMEKASMQTVALYAGELLSYFEYYLYVIDFLIGVLLWRGRLEFSVPLPRWVSIREEERGDEQRVKADGKADGKDAGGGASDERTASGREKEDDAADAKADAASKLQSHCIKVSVWFPIHSVALFEAGVICVERPSFIPAALCFGVTWIMVTIMFYRSGYPSPWHRCKTVGEITSVLLLGRNAQAPDTIEAHEGAEEAAEVDAVDRAKTERIVSFLMAFKTAALKYKREYYKTDAEALAIETEDKEWSLFESYLYYVHLGLSYLCIYLRGLRNVIVWKSSSYSYLLTATFFLLGLTCALLPMEAVLKWSGRALVWTVLGPWMKLVDIWFVQAYYRTRSELKANPNIQEPEVESLFKGEKYDRLAKLVRVAAEEAIKLKHMRECRFGSYSARVPSFDDSRFPSEPLPESTAEPFTADEKDAASGRDDDGGGPAEWAFVPGQRLRGSMIPVEEDLVSS